MLHASFLHIGKLLCPRLADLCVSSVFYPSVSIKCLLQGESSQKRCSLRQSLENCVFVIVVALFCDVHLHTYGLCWDRWPSGHNCLHVRASVVKYVEKSKHLLCVCACMLLCKLIVAICSLLSSLHGAWSWVPNGVDTDMCFVGCCKL